MENIENATKDIPLFSLNGLKTWGKIVDNYDGDTVDLVIDFKDDLTRFKCRLIGIDTAEKRSADISEKIHAIKAKNFVKDWHENRTVYIKCYNFDKYGRLLIDVSKDKNSKTLSKLLIENGLGYEYDGKTKKLFREWASPHFWQESKDLSFPKPKRKNIIMFEL